jgi:hypothetical protein
VKEVAISIVRNLASPPQEASMLYEELGTEVLLEALESSLTASSTDLIIQVGPFVEKSKQTSMCD